MVPNLDDIERWEGGDMSQEEEIVFFQKLIDSGVCWRLQGMYGRRAARLIEIGKCKMPSK